MGGIRGTAALAALLYGTAAAAAQTAGPSAVVDLAGEAAPPAPGRPYAARNLPDRIVLSPGADPAKEMSVAWRTDMVQATTIAELAELVPAPGFGLRAAAVNGTSRATTSENGPARYHQVRFAGLRPDTAYAYRLRGSAGWSEWHQFRTAKAEADAPFASSTWAIRRTASSRSARSPGAVRCVQAGNPQLMLHAGDLVASRDDMVHDDEWGEWTANGGWALATIPQIPAPGNHEYVDVPLPGGKESPQARPALAADVRASRQRCAQGEGNHLRHDWQGVRFIALDGTSALDLGTLEAQTRWLDALPKAARAGRSSCSTSRSSPVPARGTRRP
jgi:acid phosphatase type 7